MDDNFKQDWVMAILANRLQYVIKEECEIYFSFFLTLSELGKSFKFVHLYDKKTAMDFWKTFNDSPSGGTTQIGKCVNAIKDEITNNGKLYNLNIDLRLEKPEILIINDGDDIVDVNNLEWKTNAITIGKKNNGLKNLCEKTKGTYVFFER